MIYTLFFILAILPFWAIVDIPRKVTPLFLAKLTHHS